VEREAVDHLQTTPSLAQAILLEDAGPRGVARLSRWFVGGEAMPTRLLAEMATHMSGTVHNMYGPTETTVWVTTRTLRSHERITIGRPFANTKVYVLDGDGRLVAPGSIGELYIGGAQVARGYRNQPALTAERFVPDGLGEQAGGRLYRTGDKARLLPDGDVQFLGRLDFQVKLRGYRIELGEVESALRALAGVRDAVALVREDQPGLQQIVAYIVLDSDRETGELRRELRARLPEYVVPAHLVKLDAMPLMVSGKVDRRALPAPTAGGDSRRVYVAPRTPVEQVLSAMWQDILRIEAVGATDDFFELGGHSLLATQVLYRIRADFEIELPLRVAFEATTLEQLARVLVNELGGEAVADPMARAILEVDALTDEELLSASEESRD
jgi:acyl-coenzyme A synthetase/AMP-(fatty) acid ligase